MNIIINIIFTTWLLVANSAQAQLSGGYNEWNRRPVGCQMPINAKFTVHATYIDDGILMCAVEIESYSWWDLTKKSYWKNDFWFPCSKASQYTNRGSKVKGTLSWFHAMTCNKCRPGNHHTCTAKFTLGKNL